MRKPLSLFVLLGLLLPAGWLNSPVDAGWQPEIPSVQHTTAPGVQLAMQQQPIAGPTGLGAQTDLLYPEDIDPPESCHVPLLAPLGQDIEMMLGPWGTGNPLLALGQPSTWNDEQNLDSALASTNLDMVTLTTEDLVAVWADASRRVKYATWGAVSGWIVGSQLGTESTDGDPVLLSRGPRHWAVFARFGAKIKLIEWYMGSMGTSWQPLPGIDDAASDPVVVSQDAGHMAVFYRTAAGEVRFTEWEGSWYRATISLGAPSGGQGSLPIVSELSAVSRNEHHAAVFGVDANGGLWLRERTSLNERDWSDTAWVKLLEGVEIAKPAVTSRNANHIGVVVKDGTGQPHYTRWFGAPGQRIYLPLVMRASAAAEGMGSQDKAHLPSTAASPPPGWSEPVPLGATSFASPMTLVQRSRDSMVVFGIKGDQSLYEILWTEDDGWGDWQPIGGGSLEADQVLAGVTRRMNDVMLLGRDTGGQIWSKNYTSLDKPVTDQDLSSPLEGLPRAQTLAFVEGRWVWVSVTRDSTSGTWRAEARELNTGVTGYLDLGHADSEQTTNRVAVAAADLDVDGNSEVVVATLRLSRSDIDLSVLELSLPNASTLVITASPLYEWPDPIDGEDVNVAIGDLDGDQEQDEIVVGYRRGSTSIRIGIFHYTDYGLALQGGATEMNYPDHCAGVPNCTVGQHDLEMAVGRVVRETVPPLERQHLVVLDVAALSLPGLTYAQDWVTTSRLLSDTWSLEPVMPSGCNYLNPSTFQGNNSSTAADPYTAALDTGDLGADGVGDIVYSFGNRLAIVTDVMACGYQAMPDLPDEERSLAVADFDTDGRSEAAVGYRGATTAVDMVEMVEDGALRRSAQATVAGSYSVLVADTDNDTYLAELAGCKTFADIQVVAVVNGAPRWYAAGQPIQHSRGLYGCTEEGGGGSVEDGTTESHGFSVSVGYEYEADGIPGGNNHEFGFRIFGGVERLWTTGTKVETVWSKTAETGYDYDALSLGMVVYNSTEFTCYYYDAFPPTEPEARSRVMVCTPTGRPTAEDFKPLEDWHSAHWKQAAGPSWADVGHRSPGGEHTNDLEEPANYPRALPDIQATYAWSETPIKVSYSSLGGFYNYWHLSDMAGSMTETITSTQWSGTAGAGLTLWGVFVDAAWVGNWTEEDSNVTSWAETLEIGGGVEKYQDPNRLCYDIVPYIYQAETRTLAGVVYPYVEMDYYVPSDPYPCAREAEDAEQP